MFNFVKKAMADIAGTEEPLYGPEAIQPVTKQGVQYTELKKDDLKWKGLGGTNVETQTFYFTADSGHIGMAQIIYSVVMGVKTTCQFSSKIFYPDNATPPLFSTDPLDNHRISDDRFNFYADNVSFELSEDGSTYSLKSSRSTKSIVDIKITKVAPGFMAGRNGTSTYGTDPNQPWGQMFHAFWPRCRVEGSFITPSGPIDFAGKGAYSFALQGMKPHHAANRWNFVNFHSPTYSALMMEFTTPPSYGSTVVNVGGIAADGSILYAGVDNTAEHVEKTEDPEARWPEPTVTSYWWKGTTADGKPFEAHLMGQLGKRQDRIDVMAEVPGFIKKIAETAAGTRPYIYQYTPRLKLKLKIGDEEKEEEGILFTEATFIS
ncbi:uncharacterized protein PV09_06804 [Verruconis gallopava]|uniref:Survival factor 1 n=1 Tax=Verruconis gallopava TaxID=253628 RepID=A0A0D2A5G6_9PEZI|nr:uncharacterized protein PV09_06804 [Verruconis gallopava]KIW01968.1 hypothetical protein PV09_06804 [Verruconis gallopava]